MTNPLELYFKENRGRLIHKWMHYFDVYHRHFQKYIGKECVVLEIGVFKGGSLQMWKNYFGDQAKIYGIDIDPSCKAFEEKNVEILIGSQSDREFLNQVKKSIPKLDILIDDGGHTMEQQVTTFEELFDHVNDGGVYLCEDTHTSYWQEFGGGYQHPDNFIEYTKNLIDHLNAWHIRGQELQPSQITKHANSFHYYDSVIVIEKKERTKPRDELRGFGDHPFEEGVDQKELELFSLKLNILGMDIPENMPVAYLFKKPDLLRDLYPEKYHGKIWPGNGESMIGFKRLSNIEFCLKNTIGDEIKGDVIETGVWRGGACIFMRALFKSRGIEDKNVWVSDSFEGLPKPNEQDYPDDKGIELYKENKLAVSVGQVKNNFRKYDLLDDQVKFLKGWFKDTLPDAPISKLSLLRLDGDLYESTMDALFYLYPKLSVGGYCIIDDWGAYSVCKKAVEDYRQFFGIKENIETIDWTGVYWRKETEIESISREEFNRQMRKLRAKKQRRKEMTSKSKKLLKRIYSLMNRE